MSTLEAIDKEIARIESLIRNPEFKYRHTGRMRLESLKRSRLQFTRPRIWAIRWKLYEWLQAAAEWVAP